MGIFMDISMGFSGMIFDDFPVNLHRNDGKREHLKMVVYQLINSLKMVHRQSGGVSGFSPWKNQGGLRAIVQRSTNMWGVSIGGGVTPKWMIFFGRILVEWMRTGGSPHFFFGKQHMTEGPHLLWSKTSFPHATDLGSLLEALSRA